MKRLASMLITLGGLTVFALGCGGTEPGPATKVAANHLRVAPTWMAEVDLPGCDQLVEIKTDWQLLRHPLDPVLVIPTAGGEPVCADTLQGAHEAIPALQSSGLSSGAELIGLSQGDDPIPIIDGQNDQETEEETVEETEEENVPDHSEHEHEGEQTATGNVIDADILRKDDPIPIHITRNKTMGVGH